MLISRIVSVMYSRRRRDGIEVDSGRFRVDGCCVQLVMFRDRASGGGFRHSALQSNCLREVFALTLRNVRLGIALVFEQALFVVHVLTPVIVAGLAGVEDVPFSLLGAWITLLEGLISLNASW